MIKQFFYILVFIISGTSFAQQNTIRFIDVKYTDNIGVVDSVIITKPDSVAMKVRISYNPMNNQKEVIIKLRDQNQNVVVTKTLLLDNASMGTNTASSRFERADFSHRNYITTILLDSNQKYFIKTVEVYSKDNNGNLSNIKKYEL